MKFASLTSCVLISIAFAPPTHAAPAGTLLFTQPGTQILDATGAARPALRGSVLQDGERLLTPPGAISQIKLPDGSLIGMRPDSEIKLTPPSEANAAAPLDIALVRGAARVIGVELMDEKKVSNFRFQSGPTVLTLKGADLESAVIPPTGGGAKPTPGNSGPGSYQRLLVGSASVGNGASAEALVPRQVSYVGGGNPAPISIPTGAPNLFDANRKNNPSPAGEPKYPSPAPLPSPNPVPTPLPPNGFPRPPENPQPLPMPKPPLVITQPVILAPPPLIPKTCTRFIGRTCVG